VYFLTYTSGDRCSHAENSFEYPEYQSAHLQVPWSPLEPFSSYNTAGTLGIKCVQILMRDLRSLLRVLAGTLPEHEGAYRLVGIMSQGMGSGVLRCPKFTP
jgi:hypothetical protein